jgi:hypothetical protein
MIGPADNTTQQPLKHAAELFPEPAPSYRTLRRWVRHGYRGRRLQAVKYGDRWFTCAAWVQEFRDQCTAAAMPDRRPGPAIQNERVRAARDILKGFGLYDPQEAPT